MKVFAVRMSFLATMTTNDIQPATLTLKRENILVIAPSYSKWHAAGTVEAKQLVIDDVIATLLQGTAADHDLHLELTKASAVTCETSLCLFLSIQAISTIYTNMGKSKQKGKWNAHAVFGKLHEEKVLAKLPAAWAEQHPDQPMPDKWNKHMNIYSRARSLAFADISQDEMEMLGSVANLWNGTPAPKEVLDQ